VQAHAQDWIFHPRNHTVSHYRKNKIHQESGSRTSSLPVDSPDLSSSDSLSLAYRVEWLGENGDEDVVYKERSTLAARFTSSRS
jgi:hypothetical protein